MNSLLMKEKSTHARIEDEFTDLPVSRARKYQLRRQKEGNCIKCGQPQAAAFYCLKHLIANRETIRRTNGAKRRNRSLSYALEAKAKAARRERVSHGAKQPSH